MQYDVLQIVHIHNCGLVRRTNAEEASIRYVFSHLQKSGWICPFLVIRLCLR